MVENVRNEELSEFRGREEGPEPILLAQAVVAPIAPPTQLQTPSATGAVRLVVDLEPGNIVRLPATASIDQPRANGSDLEFVQADGSVIVVPQGAIQGLTIFIGTIEIPPQTVAALFDANGIEAAAGPESGSYRSSGGDFIQPVGDIGDGLGFGGLLDNSEFYALGEPGDPELNLENFAPIFGLPGIFEVRLSEEGFASANPDDLGSSDTTNSTSYSVVLEVIDPNGDPLTFAFGQPADGLTSGGVELTWTGVGTENLVGWAGSTRVIEASIDSGTRLLTVNLLQTLDHSGTGEDELSFGLPITASDGQGGEAAAIIRIIVEDDSAILGAANDGVVDENGLTGSEGIEVLALVSADSPSTGGSLAISWGSDRGNAVLDGGDTGFVGDRSVVFSDTVIADFAALNLTSNNSALEFSLDLNSTRLTATADGQTIFTVTLSDDGAGSYAFSLEGVLDHPDSTSEDTLPLIFNFVAKDADGDAVAGSFTVSVTDDAPLVGLPASATVDENGLPIGEISNPGGTGASVTLSTQQSGGALNILWGADNGNSAENFGYNGAQVMGDRSVVFTDLSAAGANITITDASNAVLDLSLLTSNGKSVAFRFAEGSNNTILEAFTSDGTVFVVELSDTGTGSYSFVLSGPLDHPVGGGEDALSLAFSFTARDGDGDSVVNEFRVQVVDDVPVLGDAVVSLGSVNEDDLAAGNNEVAPKDSLVVSAALGVSWGADSDLRGAGDVFGRSLAFDGLPNGLQSGGVALVYETVVDAFGGVTLTAYKGSAGAAVFTVTLDATTATGNATFTLHGVLDHTGADAAAMNLSFGYTATDADGDTTVPSSFSVTLVDDGPVLTQAMRFNTVSEADLGVGSDSASSSFKVHYGADGYGATAFTGAIKLDIGGGLAGNVSFDLAAGDYRSTQFTSDGRAVTFTQVDANTIRGFVSAADNGGNGDEVIVEITLTDTDSSAKTVLYGNLDHLAARDGAPIASVVIDATIRFSDGDGDAVTGIIRTTIEDGVPTVGAVVSLGSVNEDDLAAGNNEVAPKDSLVVSAALGVSWGADSDLRGAGDVFGRSLAFDGLPSGLQSGGVALVYETVADAFGGVTLTAYKGSVGAAVFTVTLDATTATGNATFTLHGVLDHTGADAAAMNLSFGYTATDADGDTTVPSSFSVTLVDDAPTISTTATQGARVQEDALPDGNPEVGDTLTTSGTLSHSFGADGGSLSWQDSPLPKGGFTSNIADNLFEVFQQQNGVIVKVFQVSLNPTSGVYELTQVAAVRHPNGNGEQGEVFNLNYRVTDGDADYVESVLRVVIGDDVPIAADVIASMTENDAVVVALDYSVGSDGPGTIVLGAASTLDPAFDLSGVSINLVAGGIQIIPGTTFDSLALGTTTTFEIPYTVTDGDGDPVTRTVTMTVTGTNDVPVITTSQAQTATVFENGDLDAIGANAAANGQFEPHVNIDAFLAAQLHSGIDMGAFLVAVQTQIGSQASLADAIATVWDYVDDNYSYYDNLLNEVSARLGVEYARYLVEGGKPLLDVVAKFVADGGDAGSTPDRLQSLHDNLLGNVHDGSLIDKLLGSGQGSNPNPVPDVYAAIVSLLTEAGQPDLSGLLARPLYSGVENSPNLSLAWDHAHGLVPVAAGQLAASDVDTGAVLTWSGTATTPYGSFVIDASNGTWTYTLNQGGATNALREGQSVVETFPATVTDEHGATDTVPVTITIVGANDAPVIGWTATIADLFEPSGVTGSGSTLNKGGSFGFGDVDAGDTHTAVVTQLSSNYNASDASAFFGHFTAWISSEPNNAALNDGELQWNLSAVSSSLDYLAAGQTITQTYRVDVVDASGAISSEVVTAIIIGTNDAPVITVAVDDRAFQLLTETNGGLLATGTLSVTDVDVTDTVTARVVSVSAGGSGIESQFANEVLLGFLSVGPNPVIGNTSTSGKINWTFNSGTEAFDFLPKGWESVLSYTIEVSDGQGGTDTQVVQIKLQGTNDGPAFGWGETAAPLTEAGDQTGSSLMRVKTGQLLFSDADISDSHTVTYETLSTTNPGGFLGDFSAVLGRAAHTSTSPNGQVLWTLQAQDSTLDFLAKGQTVTQTYRVIVTDAQGISTATVVTAKITGTNDVPVIGGDSYAVAEDGVLSATLSTGVLANDTDIDGDSLAAVLVSGPTHGSLTLNANGSFVYTPNANYNGADSFTYKANDGTTDSAVANVTLTVNPIDDVPTFGGVASGAVTEDSSLVASGTITVSDPDAGESGFLSANSLAGAYGMFTFDETTGEWTYALNNDNATVQALDENDAPLTDSLTIRSIDGSSHDIVVTIHGADEPVVSSPVTANSVGAYYAFSDGTPQPEEISINLAALFSGGGSNLTYAFQPVRAGNGNTNQTLDNGQWDWLGFKHDDASTNEIVGNPPKNGHNGMYIAKVSATDIDTGLTTVTYVAIMVLGKDGTSVVISNNGATVPSSKEDNYVELEPNRPIVSSVSGGKNNDVVVGNEHKNSLNGAEGNDALYGGAGDDTLKGGSDDDFLAGGDGDDTVYGEGGKDVLLGEAGNDTIRGGSENDILLGGDGDDVLYGEDDDDILYGGDGNDFLFGGDDDDRLFGGDGNDFLSGGEDDDILYGGDGNDILTGGDDDDMLFGGSGQNTMSGGSGDDIFVIDSSALSEIGLLDVITDYSFKGNGKDIVDLSDILNSVLGRDATADEAAAMIQKSSDGAGGTLISVDTNGVSPDGFVEVVRLEGYLHTDSVKILFDDDTTGLTLTI